MAKITRMRHMDKESHAADIVLTLLERKKATLLAKMVNRAAADLFSGGRPSSIAKMVEADIMKGLRSVWDNFVDEYLDEVDPVALVADPGFARMVAKIAAIGFMNDMYKNPSSYIKYMDNDTKQTVYDLMSARGKSKFVKMLERSGVAGERVAAEIPEWTTPEFASNLNISGTRLKAFSGRVPPMPNSVWVLKMKGKVYKDRYGWISVNWLIHPFLDGRDWAVKSILSFAPATSGSFANEKFGEFAKEVSISGKSGSIGFGIVGYTLLVKPREDNPEKDINRLISKHAADLKEARRYWKKQLAEAKKQLLARELLAAAQDIMAAEGDKCGPQGCIRKVKGGRWGIMSGKTGKMWPSTYDSKAEAEKVLERYHGFGFKK